jgi:ATP-dependent helicase/nuclease subunit B
VAELPAPERITCIREAARKLGQAAVQSADVAEWWPAAAADVEVDRMTRRLRAWRARDGWPRRNPLRAAPLLELIFGADRPFSASELETYAACPFRHFGRHVLNLGERDMDLARSHYGSLLHRVLQKFYDRLRRSQGCGKGQPLPPINGAHRDQLVNCFEEEWRRLSDGAVSPDRRTLFSSEQGVVQLVIDVMASLEAEHGNLAHEYALGNVPLGEDEEGRPVLLSGRIDRIDLHRETRQAVIVDYKTGRAMPARDRKERTADGRLLQLPLYAAALGRMPESLEVTGAAYVHLSDRVAKWDAAIEGSGELDTGKTADVPFDIEAARRKALELAGRIRAGDFSLTAHTEGRQSECTSFCPLRHACRAPAGYRVI